MTTLSLLYPIDSFAHEAPVEIQPQVLQDLGFQRLLTYLHADQYERKELARLFTHLTMNVSVIAYRQDIFSDFLTHPTLFDQFEELYELLETFRYHHPQQSRTTSSALYEVAWRISELETIVEAVRKLHEMFQPIPIQNLQSQGLQNLRKLVEDMIQQEDFQQLEANLPELAIQVRSHQSVTIGVNLNQNMLPHEAILLSVNDHKFQEANLLKKIFGTTDETREGIASLHGVISRKGASRFETGWQTI
jgi:wyosine [tRNA(Phe)-imidazoG37] synthetase (radical SAM superfamily)